VAIRIRSEARFERLSGDLRADDLYFGFRYALTVLIDDT